VNTYGYVGGNPVGFVDPLGLTIWTGTSRSISTIYGGGAIRFRFDLVSECVNNSQTSVSISAGGFALGGGAEFAGAGGKIVFEDNNVSPDTSVFSGTSYYTGIGYAFIGIGYSVSAIRLGGATSYSAGGQMGWDGMRQYMQEVALAESYLVRKPNVTVTKESNIS